MNVSKLTFLIFLCASLSACKPDPDIPDPGGEAPSLANDGVFILNEGNFQRGNASLDYYDLEADSLLSGVFEAANERLLGDVLQSMAMHDGKAYLVVNNSQKIEVVDPLTMASLATITGLTSPREFLAVSPDKAYVSDLYAGQVWVLDLTTNEVDNSVAIPGWTEEMIRKGNRIYLTNYDQAYLYQIDLDSDIGSSAVGPLYPRGQHLVEDVQGDLWLATGASLTNDDPGYLIHIDGDSLGVKAFFEFPAGQAPSELTLNGSRDTLFWLNDGVYAMPIAATELPIAPLIAEDGLFYGLGVDPDNGDIYVADAIDYVQRGVILRYDASGNLLRSFRAGIIPGDFYFP